MSRISINASQLEFEEGGHTLWVHGVNGNTILRIKTTGTITSKSCTTAPEFGSHADMMVEGVIHFCLGDDSEAS